MKTPTFKRSTGTALLTVLCLMFVLSIILAGILANTGTHSQSERHQEDSERAFFAAEAGVEAVAQYYGNGGTNYVTMTGTIDECTYISVGSIGGSVTDSWHSLSGAISVNPNGSSASRLTLTLPDLTEITQAALTTNYSGFLGSVVTIHSIPGGSGTQSGLLLDTSPYSMTNANSYDIYSAYMAVSLYNDSWDSTGVSTGKWWLSVVAAQATVNELSSGTIPQDQVQFCITSTGIANGQSRTVIRETLAQRTWGEYAMWMSYCNGIVFTTGERFYGPVFSNERITISGGPEFFSTVASHASDFSGSTSACIFHAAVTLNAPTQSMQAISFSNLQTKATLTLTGTTTIAMSKTNMYISNWRRGWTNKWVGCSSNGLIYVRTATITGATPTNADIYVGGTGTLDGRITLVSERDIYITNHIYYADNPTTNLLSNDALGMIAKRDIGIFTNWVSNITIYAHMIATGLYDTNSRYDGSFGVINWTNAPPRGRLTVHGGIVQDNRGVVSQLHGTNVIHGYYKNYTYDIRFATNPPPDYPPLSDQLDFGTWREQR